MNQYITRIFNGIEISHMKLSLACYSIRGQWMTLCMFKCTLMYSQKLQTTPHLGIKWC